MDRRRDLEWHFNPRLSVPDFAQFLSNRQMRSRQVLDSGIAIRRQSYARHPRAHYLVAPLSGATRAPAIIYIHGGYWRSGTAEDNAVLIPRFHQLGAVPILLGYPLCPEARLADVVDHVWAGIEHAWANAAALGIDEGRLLIAGTSAGAHLAAMALLRDRGSRLRAAMLFSGIYDLSPVPMLAVNDEINLGPDDVRPLSPALQPPLRNLRICFAVGSTEPALWQAQTYLFENLCRAGGCTTSLHVADGRHHFDLYEELLVNGSPIAAELGQLLRGTA